MDYYSSYKKTPVPRISDDKILERILALKKNSSISPNVFSFISSLAAGFKKYGGVTQKQYEANIQSGLHNITTNIAKSLISVRSIIARILLTMETYLIAYSMITISFLQKNNTNLSLKTNTH